MTARRASGDLKVVLLLSATINVRDVDLVQHADPQKRAREYRDALRWLAQVSVPNRVVFCENSGYDLLSFAAEWAGKPLPVEFLQFSGPRFDPRVGKGRGELGIIRHALENSAALSDADLVVKITGRYKVRNIRRVLQSVASSSAPMVFADFRRWLSFADSRVFAFHPSFAPRYLYRFESQLDDSAGFYFEHALARAIHLALADGAAWAQWPIEPDIEGFSATDGFHYDRSPPRRLARNALRRVMRYGLRRW